MVDHRVVAGGVDLLRGAGLARHHVAGDRRLAAGALDHDAAQDRRERVDGVGLEHPPHDDGLRLPHRAALAVLDPLHEDRLHEVAAVRDRGRRHRDLQAGDADLLPEGHRRQRESAPARDGAEEAARLAGQLDAGRLAEAEVAHVAGEVVAAEPLRDPDHADVARLRDGLGEREPVEDGVVVDRDARDLDAAVAAVEDLARLDHLLLQPRGGGDDLEDAARLEGVGDGAVAPARARVGLVAVRVERRPPGHGEDLAGERLDDDDHARDGLGLGHRAVELALGDVLDRLVEREHDGVALGRGPLGLRDRPAARVGVDDDLRRAAADARFSNAYSTPHMPVLSRPT